MTIVAYGNYRDTRPLAIAECFRTAARPVSFVQDLNALRGALQEQRLTALVLDAAGSVRDVARAVRNSKHGGDVPLLVLVDRLSPRLLNSLHAEGADDVLTYADLEGLTRRLAVLGARTASAGTKPVLKGECVLAHADVARRDDCQRVLEQAGFDVVTVSNAGELVEAVRRRTPSALVISGSLPPEGGRRALRRLVEGLERDIPTVLLSPGPSGPFSPQGWSVVAEEGPPANLLFVLNDMLRSQGQGDGRESRRLLYNTQCNFRVAGELEAIAGLTYNIARGGLFVRTLAAPPARTQLWIELSPPGSNQAVHLHAEVAWSTPFRDQAVGPAGFGAQIVPQLCPAADLATYVHQYNWLLQLVTGQTP